MKLKEEIKDSIYSSHEFLKKAKKLVNSGLHNLSVSSMYLSMYHIVNGLSIKQGFSFADNEMLFKWFQEFNEKEKNFNSQLPFFIRKLYAEKQNIEYKSNYELEKEKIHLWLEEVETYRQQIEDDIKKTPDYSKIINSQLKYFLQSKSLKQEEEKFKTNLIKQLKNEILNIDKKAHRAFTELLAHPENSELIGAFKIRFEDYLENNPTKLERIAEICDELPDIEDKQALQAQAAQEATEDKEQEQSAKKEEAKPREKHPIIVPWDFTKMSEYALEHAVNFAHITGGQIYLIHIIKNEQEHLKIQPKLEAEINRIKRDYNVESHAVVKTGTIFKAITGFADEIDAKLVIMGTHGKQGMQKFTGSWALKVIINTKVPFLVVQSPPKRTKIHNVVFPVDYRKEIKQKVNQAKYLSKYYDLKYYISKPAKIAIDNVRKKTLNNLYFMRSFFIQYGIEHEVIDVRGTKDWSEATLKLASEMNADLIIIVLTKELGLPNMIFGADEEKIIMNPYGIPVMCVNPPAAKNWTYNSGFG